MSSETKSNRFFSIDFLRGLVMIIMALDHTRVFFHADAFLFNPTDIAHSNPLIFLTRWITHFCAPVFIFLAGTSIFFMNGRKSTKEVSLFILKRGLWLMLLELTFFGFGWFFNPNFSLQFLQAIWVIGVSMVIMSAVIFLPKQVILAFGLLLVFGHNLLDSIHVDGSGLAAFLWSGLHQFKGFNFGGLTVIAAYPVIPWVGVMALGYCFGQLYESPITSNERKRYLLLISAAALVLFLVLRAGNFYGEPLAWSMQASLTNTILSFINVSKYPPSLLYLLIMLGPALLVLAFAEKLSGRISNAIAVFGRVPLFYYLVHIYLIHFLATLAALFTGFSLSDMVFNTWITNNQALRGYGFSLTIVYMIWIAVILMLYPILKKYDLYKQEKRKWWLSYL